MLFFKKIKKLILHPNLYLYDYFRKKLGFSKKYVTEKIKMLDDYKHGTRYKLLFKQPYLYLFNKFRKKLNKQIYPILLSANMPSRENSIGGG